MAALDDLDVLEPLARSPTVSLTTKRTLARLNRVARDAVTQHLNGNCILVHDEDAIVANVPFVRAWLRAVPDVVLKVHGVDGEEMKIGMALRLATEEGDTTFGPGAVELGPLYANPTAAFFLAHALARGWARFQVACGRRMCTVNNSMTIAAALDVNCNEHTSAERMLYSAMRFHNALFRTEDRIVNQDRDYALQELIRRLLLGEQKGWSRYHELKEHVTRDMRLGVVELRNLHLTDDSMSVVGPRVRALANCVMYIEAHNNRFGFQGVATLFAEPRCVLGKPHVPRWPELVYLDLSSTPIGSNGYPPLCSAIESKHMPTLKSLNLGNTGMQDFGARLLFVTLRHLPCLIFLDLSKNLFGEQGLTPLLPKASASGRGDNARTGIIAPKLEHLLMLGMPNMAKVAWTFLGRAIMANCFPEIDCITTGPRSSPVLYGKTAPAVLAVQAITAQRVAATATKHAMEVLNASSKRAKKKIKKCANEADEAVATRVPDSS